MVPSLPGCLPGLRPERVREERFAAGFFTNGESDDSGRDEFDESRPSGARNAATRPSSSSRRRRNAAFRPASLDQPSPELNCHSSSVWARIEQPTLRNNPNVTSIISVDPYSGIRTTLFTREPTES